MVERANTRRTRLGKVTRRVHEIFSERLELVAPLDRRPPARELLAQACRPNPGTDTGPPSASSSEAQRPPKLQGRPVSAISRRVSSSRKRSS